jgi:DNA-binding SARP family transcriptional activator
MEYRIFGGLEVRRGDAAVDLGPPKQRTVLAVLLLESGRVVSSERLVELLWGEDAPKASASLQAYVSNLRRALEPDRRPRDPAQVLLTQAPGYRLAVARSEVDALRFEDLVSQGRAELAAGDEVGALITLEAALALWAGPPLPELAGEPFAIEAAERLGNLRGSAIEALGEARLALGDAAGAVSALEPAVAEHPLREHLHGLLALALYRCGRQADALRAVDAVRRNLAESAGLDPGPQLRQLEADLFAQSPTLDWVGNGSPSPVGDRTATRPAAPDRTAAPVVAAPVPPAGQPEPTEPALVGRTSELTALTAAMDDAIAGRGSAAAVLGEPGIGKTRLVEELVVYAEARGVTTAWARCPEDGAVPPFWPTVQIGAQLIDGEVTVHRLVPPPTDLDASEAAAVRFNLHRGVAAVLQDSPVPLLLVIDDLQWADPDSLRLLAAISGELHTTRTLVVATCRPPDGPSELALLDCLAEIARSRGSLSLSLGGLDVGAVTEWLQQRPDVDVPAEVAALVHDRTAGHPLYVKELSELLAAEGRLGDLESVSSARAIPASVQFVVRRRVAKLPAPTQQLLSTAAVIGREFELDLVASITGEALGAALEVLSPALDAGLVVDDQPGVFRFSHAMVAGALAAEVNTARRSQLHASAARVLAGRGITDHNATLVAHHATEGAMAGTLDLAVEASLRASHVATRRVADEDATGHLLRAAALLARHRPTDISSRIEILIEVAVTALRADLCDEAHRAVLEAIALGESIGDADAMGRAAAVLDHPNLWPKQGYGVVEHEVVAALERTLDRLSVDPTPLRARVLSSLAYELAYAPGADRVDEVGAAAERIARDSGDTDLLVRALIARHHAQWHPDGLDERRRMASEVLSLATTHPVPADAQLVATFQLAVVEVESGDLAAAEALLDRCWQLVDRAGGLGHRTQLQYFGAMLCTARGRYEEAAIVGRTGLELYRRTRRYDVDLISLGLDLSIAIDRGELDEVLSRAIGSGLDPQHYLRLFTESVAFAFVEQGQPDAARGALVMLEGLPDCPLDWTWLLVHTAALHVRVSLGMVDEAAEVAAKLEPYAGRLSVGGSGPVALGLTDLALARAAALAGDDERARSLFEAAVAGHDRLEMPAWLARSLLHQGRYLLGTGDPVDVTPGRQALDRARSICAEVGLPYVAAQVADALGQSDLVVS